MSVPVRIIDGEQVRRLLDMVSCIEAMRQAFSLVSAGRVNQPIRTSVKVEGKGLLGLMPGHVSQPAALGIKIVSIFQGNFARGQPTHQGMVLLFDASDGAPLAILDAHAVTAIRTAAASAVATDLLARTDAHRLLLLGYGDQAVTHLDAIGLVRDISRVTVWGRDPVKAADFAALHGVEVASSIVAAVRDADIVCCLTAADRPILYGRDLPPGLHINAVGASLPNVAELDGEAVVRSRFFTDYRASAEALAGEYRLALAAGQIEPDHLLGEIGAVINGTLAGRRTAEDITCFKSLGMAAEDLIAAHLVLSRAIERDIGTMIPL